MNSYVVYRFVNHIRNAVLERVPEQLKGIAGAVLNALDPLIVACCRRLILVRARDDGQLPVRASLEAAGMDLRARLTSPLVLEPGDIALIKTGIELSLPKGVEAQVRPRSGLARRGVTVVNAPGTIDPDYAQEVGVLLGNFGREAFVVEPGMRIAQLVFARYRRHAVVFSPFGIGRQAAKVRTGGFGSTGMA